MFHVNFNHHYFIFIILIIFISNTVGEFENAFKLSEQQFEQQYGSPKPNQNERLILHCRTGARSAKAGVIAEKLGYKNVENYVGSALEWFDVNAKRYEGASSTIHDYFKFEEQQKRQEKRARSGGLDGDMSLTDNSAASATSTSTATTTTKQTAISDIQEPNIEWDSDPKLKQVFDEFQLQKQHQQKRDTPSPIFLEIYNRTKQLIQQKHGGSSLTAVSKNEVKRALEKAHDEIYAQVKQETAASQHKLNAHVDQLAKQKYPNRSVQSLSASEIAPLRAQAVKELEKQEFSK